MNAKKLTTGLLSMLSILFLILDRVTALKGAAEGMKLCLEVVIPGLFPFFFLTPLLTGALSGWMGKLLTPLGTLMGLPSGGQALLIPSFLGGYPIGAKAAGDLYRQGKLNRQEAQRLLLFCSNAGPAFFFGFLRSQFPEAWMIWSLWGIHLGSAILISMLFPGSRQELCLQKEDTVDLPEAMEAAVKAISLVCGWILICKILSAAMEKWIFWRLSREGKILISGLLELSGGCSRLIELPNWRHRYLLASVMLAFGGISVVMQTSSVIGDLSLKPYLLGKALQSLFSLLLALTVLRGIWAIPLFLLLLTGILSSTLQKRGRKTGAVGV